MTGRKHKNILKELKRRNEHARKKGGAKDDNIHGRDSIPKNSPATNTKNK